MMVLVDLTEELQVLSLSLYIFDATRDKAWFRKELDDIPCYLFRVSVPKSNDTTDKFWVKSPVASMLSRLAFSLVG